MNSLKRKYPQNSLPRFIVWYLFLLLILLVGITVGASFVEGEEVDPDHQFPEFLHEWSRVEWNNLYPGEKWAYLHGVYMGTMATYNAIAEGERNNETKSERIRRLAIFRRLLEVNALDLLQTVNRRVGAPEYRSTPLWLLPYVLVDEVDSNPKHTPNL